MKQSVFALAIITFLAVAFACCSISQKEEITEKDVKRVGRDGTGLLQQLSKNY